MKQGSVKLAAAVPSVRPGDTAFHLEQHKQLIRLAAEQGVKVLLFPELSLTGASCADLYFQEVLPHDAEKALLELIDESRDTDMLIAAGLPLRQGNRMYDSVALVESGSLLGILVLKDRSGRFDPCPVTGSAVLGISRLHENAADTETLSCPIGESLSFCCSCLPGLRIGLSGTDAALVLMPSAQPETAGTAAIIRKAVSASSAEPSSCVIYASAGKGESTTDNVYAGRCLIAVNGRLLAESEPYTEGLCIAEADLNELLALQSHTEACAEDALQREGRIRFGGVGSTGEAPGKIPQEPFYEECKSGEGEDGLAGAFEIQARGLARRLQATGIEKTVLGISGGLDSALALVVCLRTFEILSLPREQILAITMPAFGTSGTTYRNALELIRQSGASCMEISLKDSLLQHFRDIGHDPEVHNTAYENAQARERTQILLDIANDRNGLVVGTGDLSEAYLGWCTYNGDHISNYSVNCGVPKTMVRRIVAWYGSRCGNDALRDVLQKILDTPVSPELLPGKDGEIGQKTEDYLGPYILHDFFIYYLLRDGMRPSRILDLAEKAFEGVYDRAYLKTVLRTNLKRFFSSAFKRNCATDGPAVFSVSLSPRTGITMPSDASAACWLRDLEEA